MAARRPFWKWHRWKSIGSCLWPPSTCIWNLKLKFQSKLDLCSGNHVVYRQTDGRTDGQTDRRTRWIQYTPPPTSLGGGIITNLTASILIEMGATDHFHMTQTSDDNLLYFSAVLVVQQPYQIDVCPHEHRQQRVDRRAGRCLHPGTQRGPDLLAASGLLTDSHPVDMIITLKRDKYQWKHTISSRYRSSSWYTARARLTRCFWPPDRFTPSWYDYNSKKWWILMKT